MDQLMMTTHYFAMPALKHFEDSGTVRFITFSTYHHLQLLKTRSIRQIVALHLQLLRKDTGIRILGYVVMPDHVHIVLWPPDGLKLGIEIGRFKARSARDILVALQTAGSHIPMRDSQSYAVWQRRCYDHNCRTPESVMEKIEYCHKNPVASRLVQHPGDWEFSSYRWYQGERNVPLEIDSLGQDL